MSNNNATATAIISISAAVAVCAICHRYVRSSRGKPDNAVSSVSDIHRNPHATGTQVVSLYNTSSSGGDCKLYVITGATSGLGLHAARLLSTMPNAHVILGCRNKEAGNRVAKEVNGTVGRTAAECFHLDLTDFASVKAFADSVVGVSDKLGLPITGLINNAGCYAVSGTTDDGYQTTFQTNVLSHALLTELLLPSLSSDGRIVNVSSEMMRMIWNNTRKTGRAFPPVHGGDSEWDYALSKACQGLHAHELNMRFAAPNAESDSTITRRRAFAVEPGIVETNISRNLRSWTRRLNYIVFAPLVRTIDEGTATILFCLLAPEKDLDRGWEQVEEEDGKSNNVKPFYYAHCGAKQPPSCKREKDAVEQAEVFRAIFIEKSML